MKKSIILLLIIFSFQLFSQTQLLIEHPKVDKRIELLSIVFRLAGNKEYNSNRFESYVKQIDEHFKPYKNHKLIQFAIQLREEKGISYDAPMSLAISLDNDFNLLTNRLEDSFDRWEKNDAIEFVRLLKEFYRDAECDVFFDNNQELYELAVNRFAPVYESIDIEWYSAFYGNEPTENFKVVIALSNGGNSYGPSFTDSKGVKDVYAIMGTWEADTLGDPVFEVSSYSPTLIHEFNHSFVNPLLEKYKEIFKNNGEKIAGMLNDEMRSQAYGSWETVLNEALVRASVIKYFIDHKEDKSTIRKLIDKEIDKSFLWIKELVAELEKYDARRDKYPTLESYMPELAKAYNDYVKIVEKFDKERPKVISINEFENGSSDVDPKTKTITINFDKALQGEGYSIFVGQGGKDFFPQVKNIRYLKGNKSILMEVQLEHEKDYQFILTGKNFRTPDGYPLKIYEVNFKTAQ